MEDEINKSADTEDSSCFLDVELETLQSIYINETDIQHEGSTTVVCIDLHPATADKLNEKYVKMTLKLIVAEGYPDVLPEISIRNPRGLSDEKLTSIVQDLVKTAENKKGNSMLFEIIEAAKDHLTAGNRPCEECAICLYGFHDEDVFTKTECYHYFHTHCLARYSRNSVLNDPESEEEEPERLLCPVCRLPILFEDGGEVFPPPKREVEHEEFAVSDSLLEVQKKMNELYLQQVEKGGIIDLEAEKNKYLLEISHVPTITDTGVETRLEDVDSDHSSYVEAEEEESLTSPILQQQSPELSERVPDRESSAKLDDKEKSRYKKNTDSRSDYNSRRYNNDRRTNTQYDYRRNDRYNGGGRNQKYYNGDRRNNRADFDRKYTRYDDRRNNRYEDRRSNRYDFDHRNNKCDSERRNYSYDNNRRNSKHDSNKIGEYKGKSADNTAKPLSDEQSKVVDPLRDTMPEGDKLDCVDANEESDAEKSGSTTKKRSDDHKFKRQDDRRFNRPDDRRFNRWDDNRSNFRPQERRNFRPNYNSNKFYDEDRSNGFTRDYRDRGSARNEQYRHRTNFREEDNREFVKKQHSNKNMRHEDEMESVNEKESSWSREIEHSCANVIPNNETEVSWPNVAQGAENDGSNITSEVKKHKLSSDNRTTENDSVAEDEAVKMSSYISHDRKQGNSFQNRNKFSNRNPSYRNRTGEENYNPRYSNNRNYNASRYSYNRDKYSQAQERDLQNSAQTNDRNSHAQADEEDTKKVKNDSPDREFDRKNLRKNNSFNNDREPVRAGFKSYRNEREENFKRDDRQRYPRESHSKNYGKPQSDIPKSNSRVSNEDTNRSFPSGENLQNSSKDEPSNKSPDPKVSDSNNCVPTSNFLPPMSSVAPPPGFQNPTRKIVYGLAAANPPPGFNRS